MRTSGIYLGILTLAFNELFIIFLDLFAEFTGGSSGIPAPSLFEFELEPVLTEDIVLFYVTALAFLVTFLAFRRVLGSEVGWALLSIKEDRIVAESMGINSTKYRLVSFTLAGAVCGLAGGLYAPANGYISPTMFDLNTTVNVLLAGITGGILTPIGSLFGPFFVVILPEVLRAFADVRLILYGVLLILFLIYLPEGIAGWLKERW